MHFLNVFHAQDLEGLVSDGLLGLAPKADAKQPSNIFVKELFNQGVIGKSTFSMCLSEMGSITPSMIWFGGYDTNFIISNFNAYKDFSSA